MNLEFQQFWGIGSYKTTSSLREMPQGLPTPSLIKITSLDQRTIEHQKKLSSSNYVSFDDFLLKESIKIGSS